MMRSGAAQILLVLFLLFPGSASAAVIDSFVDDAFSLQASTGSPDQIVQGALATLGGDRTASLTVNAVTGTATLDLEPRFPLGRITFASESASTASLRYTAATPGVDVTDGGSATRFSLGVEALGSPMTAILRVDDDLGGVAVVPASPVTGTGFVSWPFASFAALDLTRVTFVELTLVTSSGAQTSQYRELRTRGTNQPPVADAGPDQTVFLGDFAELQGTATDADGDAITAWLWSVDSSPSGSFPVLFDEFSADTVLDADMAGDYVVSVIAFDGMDWGLPDTVMVRFALNLPPTAVALANPTTGLPPLRVHFDGSQSMDPEDAELLYAWSYGDGTDPELGSVRVHTYETQGIFTAELRVQDERGQGDLDTIDITVLPPELNAIDSGRYSSSGFHDPSDTEYQALVGGTRSFFVFDLSDIPPSQSILSATLLLDVGGVTQGAFGGIDYTLHEVSTPVPTLVAGGSGLTAIYDDLGTGTVFSVLTAISPADQGTTKSIPLLSDGLAVLNAARGGLVAVAGAPSGTLGNFAFGGTDVLGAQLVVEVGTVAVPALSPTALGMLTLMLVGSAAFMLRRVRGEAG